MQWIHPRGGMGGLAKKLTTQPCKIAYLGASVTAQKDGYLPRLHQALIAATGQSHTAINAGMGAVGSIVAVFTMDELVLKHAPDVCFIEFTTGDMGHKTPEQEIGPAVEGIVRKLQAADCPTCMLHLYRSDRDMEQDPVALEYERVAAYYGVPSLNIGAFLQAEVEQGIYTPSDLMRDHVHTAVRGAEITTALILQGLQTIWEHRAVEANYLERRALPDIYPKNFRHAKLVPFSPNMLRDPENYVRGKFRLLMDYIQIDSHNELVCEFDGDLVGLWLIVGKESGVIELRTPNEVQEYTLWDTDCHYDRIMGEIFYPFVPAHTPLRIRLTEQPMDYTKLRHPIENAEAIQKNLKILSFLVRL